MTSPSDNERLKLFLRGMDIGQEVRIKSASYWYKSIKAVHTHWALVDELRSGATQVWFIDDTSGVFDSIGFDSLGAAVEGLYGNEFQLYMEHPDVHRIIQPPRPPFAYARHPDGLIYSSGRQWKRG